MSQRIPLEDALRKKIPEAAVPQILQLVRQGRVQLRFARPRNSKLGDFRPGLRGRAHAISVNTDLNPYQFLWILVHELAHLYTWDKHQNKVAPHGKEWQAVFAELMVPFLRGGVFPDTLERKLKQHLRSAAASTCTDPELYKLFSSYDAKAKFFVDDIPMGELFTLVGGRTFRKGKKLRTRYECVDLATGRMYFVYGHAEVDLDALVSQ